MTLKYLSLCSGIEAATVASREFGWEPVAFSEIDPFCCALLKHHYPDVPNLGDMTRYDEWPEDLNPDIIVGGPPCFPAGTLILSQGGLVPIEEVAEGDLVLTHKNRWRRVVKTMAREGRTITVKGQGHWGLTTTSEHPFYAMERKPPKKGKQESPSWIPAKDMAGKFWASPTWLPQPEMLNPESFTTQNGQLFRHFATKDRKMAVAMHLFASASGFNSSTSLNKQGTYLVKINEATHPAISDGHLWGRVKSVSEESQEKVPVYNFEVEEDNSYTADGIVVHNCQSFSVAGLRGGLNDDRGNLTLDYIRICDKYRPKYAIYENVPGIFSDKTNAFGALLGGLAGLDSELLPPDGRRWPGAGEVDGPARRVAWATLDARYFGVPQRRRRLWLLACDREAIGGPGNFPGPGEILLISQGEGRDTPKGRGKGKGPPPAPEGGPGGGEGAAGDGGGGDGRNPGVGNPGNTEGPGDGLVGTLACNTDPGGHDAGNFLSNRAVDAGYIIPVKPYGIDEQCNITENGMGPLLKGGQGGTHQSVAYASPEFSPPDTTIPPDLWDTVGALCARDDKTVGSQFVSEGKVIPVFVTDRPAEPVKFTVRGGCAGGGKGYLGSEGVAFTVAAAQDQQVAVPVGDPIAFNHQEARNFHASADHTNPLRANQTEAVAIAEPVIVNMQGSKGNACVTEDGISPTLSGMHGHDVHAVCVPNSQGNPDTICIKGAAIGRQPQFGPQYGRSWRMAPPTP